MFVSVLDKDKYVSYIKQVFFAFNLCSGKNVSLNNICTVLLCKVKQ